MPNPIIFKSTLFLLCRFAAVVAHRGRLRIACISRVAGIVDLESRRRTILRIQNKNLQEMKNEYTFISTPNDNLAEYECRANNSHTKSYKKSTLFLEIACGFLCSKHFYILSSKNFCLNSIELRFPDVSKLVILKRNVPEILVQTALSAGSAQRADWAKSSKTSRSEMTLAKISGSLI